MLYKLKKLNLEFWAGQIFTIVATIIGVYLAANSGFEKAIEFENITHARDSYYVQKAMLEELKHNLAKTEDWTTEFNQNPTDNLMHRHSAQYSYNYFLWKTIQESSAVFEVPYKFVGAINDYYAASERLKNTMLAGNPFQSPIAGEKLAKLADDAQAQLVTDLTKYLEEQKSRLIKLNIKLDE